MRTVKVGRLNLLEKMKANREAHVKVVLDALAVYRREAVEALRKMLDDAAGGGEIRRRIDIPLPEDHRDAYDRVIAMLEMSVDETIELQEHEFRCYVLDEWDWQQSFNSTTMGYLNR